MEASAEKPVQKSVATDEITAEKSPEESNVAESPKTEKHDTIEVGDRFKNLRNGDICEVVSLTGAVPWQTDQCTVQRESGGFAITENIDFAKLFDTNLYEFIGNADKTAEAKKSVADTPVAEPITPEQPEKTDNFVITDDALGEGGAKTKFRNNLAAIQTLKQIEREKRTATPEEQQILSQYVGWGGIAQAFDAENKSWANEYAQLKEALTPQEYAFARSTVLDAFFTSPVIIDGIYDALNKFGFDGGNVLEPAMGVGNFFGRMPEDMRKDSKLYGVEIDSISGRIAKALYPDADIAINGFEKNSFQNGCFDVAVGNVPFGELPFKDEKHNTTNVHYPNGNNKCKKSSPLIKGVIRIIQSFINKLVINVNIS